MNEIIRKRKSIRKYEQTPLDDASLAKVREQIAGLKPLFPDIRYSVEIVGKTKGMFGVTAPHYLVFRSEAKDKSYENVGFIGQQMDLYFSGSGIGSCWLGMAKPEGGETNALPPVVCMAFGKPAEPLHRSLSEFKRKPIAEISEGTDGRIEAARLAPSGMNAQGWFFVARNSQIHCYRKKPLLPIGKMDRIDIGIAICHIASECTRFNFLNELHAPFRNGYVYVGTVAADK